MRDLIERGAPQAPRPRRTIRGWQPLALAVAGVVIGVAAAPSIAQAWPGSRAAFDQMDANHDGGVTFAEFQGR